MAGKLTADDRLEIMDLLAHYAHVQDYGTPADFLACFTKDAFLDVGYRTVEGEAELRDFADYYSKKPGRPWRHHITTITIEGDQDRARSHSYLLFTKHTTPEDSVLSGEGDYHDEFVKVDGRWRIDRHVVKV